MNMAFLLHITKKIRENLRESVGRKKQWTGLAVSMCVLLTCSVVKAAPLITGETTCDFGSIPQGVPYMHSYMIKAPANQSLHITNAYTSCECVSVLTYPGVLEPDQDGAIDIVFIPGKDGRVDYQVFLDIEGIPEPQVLDLFGEVQYASVESEDEVMAHALQQMPARIMLNRDLSLYVQAKDVLNDSKVTIVDVRKLDDFNEVHIPNSINIPIFTLKTKTFLKNVPIVLIDEGYGRPMLEDICEELRGEGFKSVSILYGGLNSWQRSGGKLRGSYRAMDTVKTITAAQFYDGRRFNDWVVIDADQNADPKSDVLLPDKVVLPYKQGDASYVPRLEGVVAGKERPLSILMLTQDGTGYAALAEALKGVKANVLFLEGGLDAYAAHVRMTAALRDKKMESISTDKKARKKCAGCPG